MLTQSDIERERYERQLKNQFDRNSWEWHARRREEIGQEIGKQIGQEIGQKIGQEIGKQIGIIRICEDILQRQETPEGQLLALSLEDLTRLAEDLKKQTLSQR